MTATARYTDRPWVAPEACSRPRGSEPEDDLQGLIDSAAFSVRERSRGRVIHALVALSAALRSRLSRDELRKVGAEVCGPHGPWKRRLRRRYAASLCSIDRLLDEAWERIDSDALFEAVQEELGRLRRLESLENRAYFDQYWTDLGVGD